jgi:hypothetical protein
MPKTKPLTVESPIGQRKTDSAGSPVGVVRMDVDKSYADVGELLQKFLNDSDEGAWERIAEKIDYTFENLDLALRPLAEATGLGNEIRSRLDRGQKLLFKPNLVNPTNIDPQTNGPDFGYTACTEWSFMAALMRWFHDMMGVRYGQMAVGEAATMLTAAASDYSMMHPAGKTVTPEAVMEGKCGDFYCGWGFYFARKYLSERLKAGSDEDPMQGYEESVAGTYIPMGLASDKLMVYDLNRISDDPSKGLECEVPDGVNYKSITLHKAIVGGDKGDPEDLKANPGCILVNVPKFKVHAITLFTNIIKNLGIGLYPMQYSGSGTCQWDYSIPHTEIPGIKGGIPHQVWVGKLDPKTGYPLRDGAGNYKLEKTGGINATMIDVIQAAAHQGTLMIHVVDGIEAINIDHQGMNLGEKSRDGMVFAGLDPVAADLLCARYMFSNVPLEEALQTDIDDGAGGRFPQAVPIPVPEGNNIVSKAGYDCPLARDTCFEDAEKRGLGERRYHVVGHDSVTDSPLVSLEGHLGYVKEGTFFDVVTETLFYDTFSFPWNMQKTALSYMEASDRLAGTSHKEEFLKAFDEDGDGVVTYNEFGKKGLFSLFLNSMGAAVSVRGSEPFGYLKGGFFTFGKMFKTLQPTMNAEGHDVAKEWFLGSACCAAYNISLLEEELPDPFVPGLVCGKGKWPSMQLARFVQLGANLYGLDFPQSITFPSLYLGALLYADLTQNGGHYAGKIRNAPNIENITKYIDEAPTGKTEPLDFVFYVPEGFDNLFGKPIPNVQVTDDPSRMLTVHFAGGAEIWP